MYQNQASHGGSEEGAADMYQGITDGAAGGAEGMKQGSQPSGAASAEPVLDFGAEGATASPTSPSLFDQPQMQGVNRTPKNIRPSGGKICRQNRKERLPKSVFSTMIRPGKPSFLRNKVGIGEP